MFKARLKRKTPACSYRNPTVSHTAGTCTAEGAQGTQPRDAGGAGSQAGLGFSQPAGQTLLSTEDEAAEQAFPLLRVLMAASPTLDSTEL